MPSLSANQLNHNEITDQENNINTTEQSPQHLSRLQNEIGSKVLSLVNFESRHKDIVESSFNKARQNKEKLPGKNNERRNFAYLSRLDRMIKKTWRYSRTKTLDSLCRKSRHGLRGYPRRLLETTRTNPKRQRSR